MELAIVDSLGHSGHAEMLANNHLVYTNTKPTAVLALDPQNKKARFRLGACIIIMPTFIARIACLLSLGQALCINNQRLLVPVLINTMLGSQG